MKRFILLLLFPLIIMNGSCSHSIPASKILPKAAPAGPTESYSLIVSFFSIGEGVDGKALEGFHQYVTAFEHSEMTKINVEEVRWGREGEVDYCMQLQELYATQQERFVQGIKDLFKNNKLVNIAQNGPCMHKRK